MPSVNLELKRVIVIEQLSVRVKPFSHFLTCLCVLKIEVDFLAFDADRERFRSVPRSAEPERIVASNLVDGNEQLIYLVGFELARRGPDIGMQVDLLDDLGVGEHKKEED